MNAEYPILPSHKLSPIGKLIPNEIPLIMPVERIVPDELYRLGAGTLDSHNVWVVDERVCVFDHFL